MKKLIEVIKSKKVIKRVLIAGGTLVGLAIVGVMLKPKSDTDDDSDVDSEDQVENEVSEV